MRARAIDAGFLALLLLIAAVPLWPVYQHVHLFVVVAGGMLLGCGVAVVGARWRWPAYLVVAAACVLLALVGVPLAVPTAAAFGVLPTLSGLAMLATGAVFGWKDMLSVPLPLGDYQALLVPTLLVVTAAATAGMSVVLRARRPGWAFVAPVAVFLFGLAFGGAEPLWPAATSAVFVIVAVLWIARGVGASAPGRARWSRLAAGAALVGVAVATGATVSAVAPPGVSRAVVRDAVAPPFDLRESVSPLVAYRNSVLPPGDNTTMLRVKGLPEGARIRLAVLDDYDGRVFVVGADPDPATAGVYERIPLRIDRDRAPAGTAARVTVTVDGYRGTWLPTVGAVGSVSLPVAEAGGFFYNRVASAGALAGGIEGGLSYTMDTVVAGMPSDKAVAAAVPAAGGARQGEVPAALAEAVAQHGGDGTPGERLLALAGWLRAGYRSDGGEGAPFSRAGHSIDRLAELVEVEPMLGDAEQYAPALALMARQLGFPSRVVVGYAPTSDRVTGADLTAWVEVRTAGGDWLAVDPNPPVRDIPIDQQDATDSVAQPETALPPPPPTRQDAVSSDGSEDDRESEASEVPEWRRILDLVIGIAAIALSALIVLLAPFWLPALLRGIRRSRRRRRDRKNSVVTGGWQQVRDRVAELGVSLPPAATRREVADLSGSEEVTALAERADRAVFDAVAPSRADVDAYWADVPTARSRLLRGLGIAARVRVLLSWRGILGGAGTTRTTRREDATWQ